MEENKTELPDEKQLEYEIRHIFESGANEIRVYETMLAFMNKIKSKQLVGKLEISNAIPYQCCPKCNGEGRILNGYTHTAVHSICDVCNGRKIFPMFSTNVNHTSLNEARALWKSLPTNKLWEQWSPAELFTKEMLLKRFSAEELNI